MVDDSESVDEDREAVERFRAGDKEAFNQIALKYEEGLQRLLVRYVKNTMDAQDLCQRTFLRAFEKIDQFRGDSSFRTWLFRIGIHLALNHRRDNERIQPSEFEDVESFTNALETKKLVATEVWQKVSARLESLPPKQRLVVELRLFHELPFREIAVVADCTEEAAKANFHHAVKKVREGIDYVVKS